MTDIWALTAAAGEVDAKTRAELAAKMEAWIAAGSTGISLVTCHRAELYGIGPRPMLGPARLLSGDEASRHLLRVAAGLESAIVGEDEVLHQVRTALRTARTNAGLDFRLGRIFEVAIATGRRARANHPRSEISLADRAVEWLAERVDLNGARLLVVGAGRMGAAAARAAMALGAKPTVASRSRERAARLAALHGVEGHDLKGAAIEAPSASAVIVALAGPWVELSHVPDGLPPIADLSAPPALPDDVRARVKHHLSIDELITGSPPPPGYLDVAAREVDRSALELEEWFAARDKLELRKAAAR